MRYNTFDITFTFTFTLPFTLHLSVSRQAVCVLVMGIFLVLIFVGYNRWQ